MNNYDNEEFENIPFLETVGRMMKKLALIVPSQHGVEYHRLMAPFYDLHNQAKVKIVEVNGMTPEHIDKLDGCDAVVFNRMMNPYQTSTETIDAIKDRGIKIWVDVDDSWELHPGHLMEHYYRKHGVGTVIKTALSKADVITCTHSRLMKSIEKVNSKSTIIILPNALNPNEKQWEYVGMNEQPDIFGWMGSTAHKADLKLLSDDMNKYWKDPNLSWRFIMAGASDQAMKEWMDFRKLLSANNSAPVNRFAIMKGLPVWEYAKIIESMDVGIIPLVDNEFNRHKSELKVLEFGMKGKAVIVSAIHPYTNICTPDNSYLCKDRSDFYRHMKRIEKRPHEAIEKADRLHEDVKRLYNWENIQYIRSTIIENL